MPGSLETRIDPNDPALHDPSNDAPAMTPRPGSHPQPESQNRTTTGENLRDEAADDVSPGFDAVPPRQTAGSKS